MTLYHSSVKHRSQPDKLEISWRIIFLSLPCSYLCKLSQGLTCWMKRGRSGEIQGISEAGHTCFSTQPSWLMHTVSLLSASYATLSFHFTLSTLLIRLLKKLHNNSNKTKHKQKFLAWPLYHFEMMFLSWGPHAATLS